MKPAASSPWFTASARTPLPGPFSKPLGRTIVYATSPFVLPAAAAARYVSLSSSSPASLASILPPNAFRKPYAGEEVFVTPAPEMTTSLLTLFSMHARATSTNPFRSTRSGSPLAGAVHAKNTALAPLVAVATVSGRVTSAIAVWSSGDVHGTTVPVASSPSSSLASNVPLLVHARTAIFLLRRLRTISRPVLPFAPSTTEVDASGGAGSTSPEAALMRLRRVRRARRGAGAETPTADDAARIAECLGHPPYPCISQNLSRESIAGSRRSPCRSLPLSSALPVSLPPQGHVTPPPSSCACAS